MKAVKTQIKDSGINWHPRKGDILICDFSGNIVPEIVKKRPVLVISPKLPYRSGLVTVVPLSTTPPEYNVDYVVKLSKNYLTNSDNPEQYAKCDLVCSVSLKRLDRIKMGFRKYAAPKICQEDLDNIIQGIKCALGVK